MRLLPLLVMLAVVSSSACSTGDSRLPEPYRSLEVPEDRLASPEARARGREIYLQNCAICHGKNADGHGPRRASLSTLPRDYADPAWRERATPRSVYAAIREGVQGTAMPAWPIFSPEETWDLVAYVLSVARQGP